MTTLMKASNQWASRPHDERFTSLYELRDHFMSLRRRSASKVLGSRTLECRPDETDDFNGLVVRGPGGHDFAPTHWAFGQLSQLSGAPAGYLRTLPSPIAADCINYGIRFKRDASDVGCLLTCSEDGLPAGNIFRAATGANYGRVWNVEVADALAKRFGDGVTGDWHVPGEFGKRLEAVTKSNTTLFASDEDMFVFLADEEHRIEMPNRRNGQPGSLARGFFVWNSEVGGKSLGLGFFLFDFVCCNRIVWGAEGYQELRIRHTSGAPERWLRQMMPALQSYANGAAGPVEAKIIAAQHTRVDDIKDFLGKRFGLSKSEVAGAEAAHAQEEHRPIGTAWDAIAGVTAYAKTIGNQSDRVKVEAVAGDILSKF